MIKTAVIYARYSSDSQTEQSIDGQLRVCEEYAQKNDILILDTYIDRAMTGTNDNRPDFQRMIRDSAKRLCARLQIRQILAKQVRNGDTQESLERQRR